MTLDENQRQLVELITREVLAALQAAPSGDVRPHRPPAGGKPRAQVRPPLGACTGDYSKFPELRDRIGSNGAQVPAPAQPGDARPAPAVRAIPLTGIITANQLQQAWDSAPDGVAAVATEARLTPLANDLARQHPDKIRRVTVAADDRAMAGSGQQWLYWCDGHCDAVHAVLSRRRDRLHRAAASQTPSSLPQVVRELAAALKAESLVGGVLFVANAARATCYANRCQAVRAVVGTCPQAVDQAVTELGANVLLIEYPYVSAADMDVMVERIMHQVPAAGPQVHRELADLDRC